MKPFRSIRSGSESTLWRPSLGSIKSSAHARRNSTAGLQKYRVGSALRVFPHIPAPKSPPWNQPRCPPRFVMASAHIRLCWVSSVGTNATMGSSIALSAKYGTRMLWIDLWLLAHLSISRISHNHFSPLRERIFRRTILVEILERERWSAATKRADEADIHLSECWVLHIKDMLYPGSKNLVFRMLPP